MKPLYKNKCTDRRGIGHFLMHSRYIPTDQVATTNLSFYHLALALGFCTPYIQAHEKWRMAGILPFQRAISGIRHGIWQDVNLLHGLYDRRAFVAPESWPKAVWQAFALEDPPNPYEMACVLLIEPHSNFWGLGTIRDPRARCDLSVLQWWLMGVPMEAIETHLGQKGGKGRLTNAVKHLMAKEKFAVWALGANLIPACTNRAMMLVAEAFMCGKPETASGLSRRIAVNARKRLLDHPYIRTQLKSGVRIGELCRPIYMDGIVWISVEEKEEWERTPDPGAKRIRTARKKIAFYESQHPEWLQLSALPFPGDSAPKATPTGEKGGEGGKRVD